MVVFRPWFGRTKALARVKFEFILYERHSGPTRSFLSSSGLEERPVGPHTPIEAFLTRKILHCRTAPSTAGRTSSSSHVLFPRPCWTSPMFPNVLINPGSAFFQIIPSK